MVVTKNRNQVVKGRMQFMKRAPVEKKLTLTRRNLKIAERFVSPGVWDAEVVVGVALHNQSACLARCINSVLSQRLIGRRLAILILDDNSTDNWLSVHSELLSHPSVVVVHGHCGTPARTRNAILDFADEFFLDARWVARLDADDRFSEPNSLECACRVGEKYESKFVLGGNRLVKNGDLLDKTNPASEELLCPQTVMQILRRMADGTADNELPSCNLLLAGQCGHRYPDKKSAEDHWLVADLLVNRGNDGSILEQPYLCDYTLTGFQTVENRMKGHHSRARSALLSAAETWCRVNSGAGTVLGKGGEGIVSLCNGKVMKSFYPGIIQGKKVSWLKTTLPDHALLPEGMNWLLDPFGSWCLCYPHFDSSPVVNIKTEEAKDFLLFCLEQGIAFLNIKRANFRRSLDGQLRFIDIGNDIVPMRDSFFLDSAARLYAISTMQWSDSEMQRRKSSRRQEDILDELPGFSDFYRGLICEFARSRWSGFEHHLPSKQLPPAAEVTLMLKACAMDAGMLIPQVRHIVSHLEVPRKFCRRLLLIDSFEGPFLREHSRGSLNGVVQEAEILRNEGFVDDILIAPCDNNTIRAVNERWFGVKCNQTHSIRNIPVTPQLWGFEQVDTRYVLQCDVDALIGRRALDHDYLTDMLKAMWDSEVLAVGFNIPHSPYSNPNPYRGQPGEFAPEVRCGLLDLQRINLNRPYPNTVVNRHLKLSWYRAIQQAQGLNNLKSLRGGDPRTFYIHPENHWKHSPNELMRIRDLVGQGRIPTFQFRHWDLQGTPEKWSYDKRSEEIVFLVKGRNTPTSRISRCFASLRMQDDQSFGVIIIDDASNARHSVMLPEHLGGFEERTTMIRRENKHGRMPNIIQAIRDVCSDPTTLVVVLDLDDALFDDKVVSRLRKEYITGADVILGGMFRPDKPCKLYKPGFDDPRSKYGDNVWIHLRSFRKCLFDAVPEDHWKINDDWITECTDYAIMIPIVELAKHPVFIPQYLYYHERTTARTQEARKRKDSIIEKILTKKPLTWDKKILLNACSS